MCLKFFILTFAVTAVSSRPQFHLFKHVRNRILNTFTKVNIDQSPSDDTAINTLNNQLSKEVVFLPNLNNRPRYNLRKEHYSQDYNLTPDNLVYHSNLILTLTNKLTKFITNKRKPNLDYSVYKNKGQNKNNVKKNNRYDGSKQNGKEGRISDDAINSDDDRFLWGAADIVDREIKITSPDLNNKSTFSGSACPKGQIKVMGICVDSH